LLAASAGFVVLLLWLQPPPPACLVLLGAGYEDNLDLPHNVPGRRALEQFAQLAGNSAAWSVVFPRAGRLRLQGGIQEFRLDTDWPTAVAACAEPTLVVFMAVHGGADPMGPYLLPAEARPDPKYRIRLEGLFDRLAALPAAKNKVLILDSTRLDEHWPLGMLQNDFARALLALEPRIAAIPNLVVFVSSAADQVSWDRGAGDTTVFSHYFLQGLAGAAPPTGGQRLTAWDLHAYVRDRVQHWVRTYRKAEQTPLLLPRATGEQRARAIPMAFRLCAPSVASLSDPLPTVQALWQRVENLKRQSPAALLRTPRLWKRLELLAIRHEQLMLAGDRLAVDGIRDLARETEEEIRRRQNLPLTAGEATLAMPALAGEMDLDLPDRYDPFERLWQAPPADRLALWAKLQNAEGTGSRDQARLRRRIFESLVRRAADDPRQNLSPAADLAIFVHEACGGILPAEAHFLVMLDRDLPRPLVEQNASLVCRALRIRLQAERAALCLQPGSIPYVEHTQAWVSEAVTTADADRRLGEDLLFATEADDLARAARYLNQAEQRYRQAAADAAVVRSAFEQRDLALYELTWYARWAAESRDFLPQDVSDAIAAVWQQTHDLGQVLRSAPSRVRLPEVKRLAENIRSGMERLRVRFEERVRAAAAADPDDLYAALEVATLPLPLRTELLRHRISSERRAMDGLQIPSAAQNVRAADPNAPRIRARRRGLMALAALGDHWFDASAGPERESFAEVRHRIQTFAVEEQWWQSLGKAGDEIGERWRSLASEPARLLEKARRERSLDQIHLTLWEADQLVRRALTADGEALPSGTLRTLLVCQTLLFQARRIAGDHWADERAGIAPYYQTTAQALLRDARLGAERESFSLPGIADVESRLRESAALELLATRRVPLTAGERARLTVSLAAPPGTSLCGFPMVWSEMPPATLGADALQLTGFSPGRRTAMAIGLDPPAVPLRVEMSSPLLESLEAAPPAQPAPLATGVSWFALHRGFRLEQRTEAVLYPCADAVQRWLAPPPGAAVAVAAEKYLLRRVSRARGALAVVLDCSGSMGPAAGQPPSEPSRFQLVTRALRALLADTPPGTMLSLWIFGQAVGEERTVEPVERTITRLQDPVVWTGEEKQTRELLERVERITPWNQSPVLRAMLEASQDLLRADGSRTLFVFTDGIDNRFTKDAELNPKCESVADTLRNRFRGTGIGVHVVGFQVACGEEAEAHRQFDVVAEFDPPGSFSTVGHIDELMASVYRLGTSVVQYGLACRDFVPSNSTQSPVAATIGSPDDERLPVAGTVGPDDEELRWMPLATGGRTRVYQVEILPSRYVAGTMSLAPGDVLSLRLVPRASEFGLERLPFVRRNELPSGRAQPRGGWLAAVPQYDAVNNGLRLLATLEEQPSGEEYAAGGVRLRRPADVWMQVDTASGQAVAARWTPAVGYPAPAWRLDVPAWPVDAGKAPLAASLRVWWLADRPAEHQLSLRKPDDFDAPENLARTAPMEGGNVTIESVQVEPHQVEAAGGDSKAALRWCVAVRVAHPVDRPVRASFDGLERLAGEEHRYYRGAGKYVGLFWFSGLSTRDEVNDRLRKDVRAMHLTSVASLCKAAEKEGHAVEFVNLGKPALGSATPRQPVPLH
jgi:hypothetical protein